MGVTAVDVAAETIFTPRRVVAEEWEGPAAAAAATHTLPSGIVVSSWGTAGPAVLLVHGWEGRATQFAGLIELIVASGRRAIAVDAPGHGRSPDSEFSPVLHGKALLEALPYYSPFEALVTHSFGSTSAFFALRRGLRVTRMALISPLVSLSERLDAMAEHFGLTGELRTAFLVTVARKLDVPIHELDLDLQPEPDGPVLLCHDTDDREIPIGSTRALADLWPSAALMVTTGLRHRRIVNDRGVIDTVADHIGLR